MTCVFFLIDKDGRNELPFMRKGVRVAETVGTRIRAARKQKGWSQAALGARIGHTGRQRMYELESGRKRPTLRELEALALALNVTSDFLLGLRVVCKDSIVVERVQDSAQDCPGACPHPCKT
jgi:DNA-binding XRE family transcriptional regulator